MACYSWQWIQTTHMFHIDHPELKSHHTEHWHVHMPTRNGTNLRNIIILDLIISTKEYFIKNITERQHLQPLLFIPAIWIQIIPWSRSRFFFIRQQLLDLCWNKKKKKVILYCSLTIYKISNLQKCLIKKLISFCITTAGHGSSATSHIPLFWSSKSCVVWIRIPGRRM